MYLQSKLMRTQHSHFIQQLLLGGGQLICERVHNSQRLRRDAAFAKERLEALEDCHTKMCLFQVIVSLYSLQLSYSWFILSCLSSSKAQWTLHILFCRERIGVQHLDVQINSYQCTCKSVGVTHSLLDEDPIMAGLRYLRTMRCLPKLHHQGMTALLPVYIFLCSAFQLSTDSSKLLV